jgi:hypothetical protein
VGTLSFTAKYGGDSNHLASTSAVLQQAILGTTQLQVTATGGGQTQAVHVSVTLQ